MHRSVESVTPPQDDCIPSGCNQETCKDALREKHVQENYSGILRCDAYSIYDDIFVLETPKPGMSAPTEQGCWAHAPRKFRDAFKVQPDAEKIMTWPAPELTDKEFSIILLI